MNNLSYIQIPTWEDGVWSLTEFETRDAFRDFVLSVFKEPGKYEFDETSYEFNSQATLFNKQGFFCSAAKGTRDFRAYWDDQKAKCRLGAIFKNGWKKWYLPREYYMWLNFLQIFDKVKNKTHFPDVRDAQLHISLYELLAELHYQHAAVFKKRQCASSYLHAAKLINQIWFEEGVTLKMGASLRGYIDSGGTWKYLDEYESFLNKNTAWYRPLNPGKPMHWHQKIEEFVGGKKIDVGLKGSLLGLSFEQSAVKGVGGPCKIFYHEEAGIAPKMGETYEYILPAMQDGMITTGIFIAAGSVGDLDDCEPLKDMIIRPRPNQIYPVTTNLLDSKGTIGESGLFIPEQWSMPPFIDKYGNSMVDQAFEAIMKQREQWKKELDPGKYQLRISQHPTNIEEGFAFRKESVFPVNLTASQKRRIEDKEYPYECIELSRSESGKIESTNSQKLPIREFPVKRTLEDKTGVIVVWERPVKDPPFGMYYASIDPVSEGKSTTSESLCSIIIYKNDVEVTKINGQETETFIEKGKIVASWCGRFDNINKTHEKLEMMIEWYNAWTLVENNVSLFIQYMIAKRKQKYLVPKNQILFLKETGSNNNVYQEYGWRNVGTIFKSHLLSYAIEFLSEELDTITKDDGTIVRTTYGVERIPDLMLITEMEQYHEGLNVDRLVSFAALAAFVKIQQSNRGYLRRVEKDPTTSAKNPNFTPVRPSIFRHMGKETGSSPSSHVPRRPFKNLR